MRVRNYGGTTARDIHLNWGKPLRDAQGKAVTFGGLEDGRPDIPALLPDESIAVTVGAGNVILAKYKDMDYSGEIEFKDASGKTFRYPVFASAEKYRNAPLYEEEVQQTHAELQKIPGELSKLLSEVQAMRKTMQQRNE